MSNGSKGDQFDSEGGNMNVAKDQGTAIQINELHIHGQQEPSGRPTSSAPTEKSFEELELLLAQNKVLEAIQCLQQFPEHRREAINFSRRWHAIQDKQQKQLISAEDAEIAVNAIADAILAITTVAPSSYPETTPPPASQPPVPSSQTSSDRNHSENAADSEHYTKYRENMEQYYGTMSFVRLNIPIPLESIFTRVRVLSQPSAIRYLKKEDWEDLEKVFLDEMRFDDVIKDDSKDALKAVCENRRLCVLGRPGSGKTTLLKYITLLAVQDKLEPENQPNPVPIFVPLREFADSGETLIGFIIQQLEIFDFPCDRAKPSITQKLKEGRVIILCDGLDEVNNQDEVRKRVIQELLEFQKKYAKNRMVITCRIAAESYHFEHFTYVEMADFQHEQINNFVTQWFKDPQTPDDDLRENINGSMADFGREDIEKFFAQRSENPQTPGPQDNTSRRFLAELKKRPRLQELAQTPLILALLCIAFKAANSKFPEHRSDIYKDALDVLLEDWDDSRRIERDVIDGNLSLGIIKQMFACIAAEAFKEESYLFKEDVLYHKISSFLKPLQPDQQENQKSNTEIGKIVLKAIESQYGVFVERARRIHSFTHITFQEYYTARYFVDNNLSLELLYNHLHDSRWREVFLLTVEMLDNTDEFFASFLETINKLIQKDQGLVQLFTSITEIAGRNQSPMKPLSQKVAILFYKLMIARDLARAGNHEHALTYARAIAFTFELGLAINDRAFSDKYAHRFAYDITLDRDHSIKREHSFSQNLSHDLTRDRAFVSTRALTLSLIHDYSSELLSTHNCNRTRVHEHVLPYADAIKYMLNRAIESSRQQGLDEVCQALRTVVIPRDNALTEEWDNFTNTMLRIFQNSPRIKEYEFTEEQITLLVKYLKASELFVSALKNDRERENTAIEDQLLSLM